jgi:predicted DNA-binding transcriptional regulator AlpA
MDHLLDAKAAAEYLRLSASTLARRRCQGTGPKFLRAGDSIRYRISDLEAWLVEATSTSETAR